MLIGVGSLTLLWMASLTPGPEPQTRQRYAIVIGENHSEDPTESPLRFADDDALATHRLLSEAGVKSVLLTRLDEDTKRLHPDAKPAAPPSLAIVFERFEALVREIAEQKEKGRESELLFFYSGHGNVERGEGYVVLDDGRLTRRDLFEKLLDRSAAVSSHVIIDACRSYFLVFEKGPGGRRRPALPSFLMGSRRRTNIGFVLSTSSDRESHEWARFQAGVFSHEVRSALRGGADANADGRITYGELGAFIARANQAIPNAEFRPDAIVIPPGDAAGDLSQPILSWNEPRTRLSVAGVEGLGHIYLENAEGSRILDAHPKEGEILVLRLPPERPLFLRKADGSAEYAITGETTQLAMIAARPSSASSKGALSLAFKRLFEAPFGRSEVLRFERERPYALEAAAGARPAVLEPSAVTLIRRGAPWVAGGSALAGAALTFTALFQRGDAERAAQSDREMINETIHGMNAAAVIAYSTAAAALVTWGVISLWTEDQPAE